MPDGEITVVFPDRLGSTVLATAVATSKVRQYLIAPPPAARDPRRREIVILDNETSRAWHPSVHPDQLPETPLGYVTWENPGLLRLTLKRRTTRTHLEVEPPKPRLSLSSQIILGLFLENHPEIDPETRRILTEVSPHNINKLAPTDEKYAQAALLLQAILDNGL